MSLERKIKDRRLWFVRHARVIKLYSSNNNSIYPFRKCTGYLVYHSRWNKEGVVYIDRIRANSNPLATKRLYDHFLKVAREMGYEKAEAPVDSDYLIYALKLGWHYDNRPISFLEMFSEPMAKEL